MSRHYANKQGKAAKAQNWKETVLRLWRYLSVHKGHLILVMLLVVASSVLGLLGPYLVGQTVDHYLMPGQRSSLGAILLIIALVYMLFSISGYLQNYLMVSISQKTVFTIRSKLFGRLHDLPMHYFDRQQHGETMSRLTNDMDNISQTLNSSFIQIISSILTLAGTLGVMLFLSPVLTVVAMTVIPLMFLGMRWITNRTGPLFKEQQKYIGELNGFIQETISGQKVVKTFSREKMLMEDFKKKNERLRVSGYWAQTYSGFIPKLMNMLNNLGFALIAGAGGLLALKGSISVGTIIIFAEYSRQFTRPLNDLANQFNTLLSAVAGAERVFSLLDEEIEGEEEACISLETLQGNIEFRNVSFEYEASQPILKDISFKAHAGETVALVGPTGAGKSTIIQLITRLYEIGSGGEILLDGYPIRSITRNSLRKRMGFVLQDPFMFRGTIMENIRFGNLEASDEEVVEAAKKANAHSFITKLPNAYETLLAADGQGISQGQKQLISIARAMLADPSLLILDEATSNIDTITEIHIQEALYRLMKGRTTIVIAHRLNTIQRADQIIVINHGEIIEKGTHESLLKMRGFYHRLFHSKLETASG
ncbi:MAG TPA: ABC transporter ATP-binding protein [Bacillaceae bacterium]